ncbi:hypothetical protein ACFWG0_03020 [Streptomyces yangpuensis]
MPRSVIQRIFLRLTVWGARATVWGMRLAARRLLRAIFLGHGVQRL